MIKIRRIIKEGNEQEVDKAATEKLLTKFASLSNSEPVITAISTDLGKLSGDNKYKAIAYLLLGFGVKDTELSSVASKLKEMLAAAAPKPGTQTQAPAIGGTPPAAPAPAGAQGAPTK
jgi:hypothetical protein